MKLASLVLFCAALQAQSPNGVWQGLRSVAPDRTEPITFRFKLEAGRLQGSVRTSYGEVPLEEPGWSGNEFRFLSHQTFGEYKVEDVYTGTINGEELSFTAVRNGRQRRSGTAKRTSTDPEPYARTVPRTTPPSMALEPNGLALTPPMGWNSWNRFQTKIDGRTVREIADALVATGLRDAGYVYVVIDDGWQGQRDDKGVLQPNEKFPSMKELVDYVHSRGLKFGIYSSPGPKSCAGFEGSWAHEEMDARTWASWGVDYLKYDWCSGGLVWDLPRMGDAYRKMSLALRATGRPIIHSVCQYGLFNVQEWAAAAGGNLWRTTGDIGNSWGSVAAIGFNQKDLDKYAGPGRWNDPDMLEIGNGGLNAAEERSHMTLWAMLAAPLMLGNDIRQMTPETLAVLSNREVIAVDQDPLGKQGYRLRQDGDGEVWVKPLARGEWAVALFNRGRSAVSVRVDWQEMGLKSVPSVRDLWKAQDLGRVSGGISEKLESHACALYRLRP